MIKLSLDAIMTSPAQLISALILILLVTSSALTELIYRIKLVGVPRYQELRKRIFSWWIIILLILLMLLGGRIVSIFSILLLSLACFREYSRAVGLFSERLICALVVTVIFLVHFSALDNWFGFFNALASLSVIFIVAIPIFQDRPQGYVQRCALGVFGFMFFGYSFGHLAFMPNDSKFQEIILMLLFLVEGNDISAYIFGSLFGKKKLSLNTSPGKTLVGSLGAIFVTMILTYYFGAFVFSNTRLESAPLLMLLGLVISITGQLGDLMLSSIKRDVGVKDLGAILPGHGGLLDRFDSLVLAAPAFFHFVYYYGGITFDAPLRIITGN